MGFRDLLLFYVVTGFSLRWIAEAAGAGPSALVIWVLACFAFYVPLVCCVLELSSRFPDEGGIYVWNKRAFGGFAGFLTGWLYWTSNLPYFPSLLLFTVINAAVLTGARGAHLAASPVFAIVASLLGLALAVGPNVAGLRIGKWVHNAGAIGLWAPAMLLVVMSFVIWARFGSATSLARSAFVPSTHLKDVIFWSTIAFSVTGVESASMMGDEIRDPRRNIPRALLAAGLVVTSVYILSTLALMLILPARDIQIVDGLTKATLNATSRLGVPGLALVVAALIVVSGIGQAGAWFAAAGRLPFVAGLDRYLPPVFGRVHPRWGSPYVALLVQAVIAALFIVLAQAGTTVAGAYDVLVSTTIIAYFLPYALMFAALIAVQRMPAGPEVFRVPGGRPVAIVMGLMGLAVTVGSIGLSVLPAADEQNKPLAVAKIIGLTLALVMVGVVLYLRADRAVRRG
jgi:glutamate:GABA antiporter